MKSLKYSFVLPIYNPPESFKTTLKCYENLNYDNFELILVDDSTDDLSDLIDTYQRKISNLIYLKRNLKDGLDAAFNHGILNASGDIIVMATDDNRPEPYFLNKLNIHYKNGIDVVIVRSKVTNYKNINAIYQSCYENSNYNNKNYKPKWSEGFSARKDCLISVGLYPNLGVDGGNDNLLSEKLEEKFKVKRDFDILMHHRGPDNIKEFFNQQIQRGSAGPQFDLLYYKKKKNFVIIKYFLKTNIMIFNFVTQLFFLSKSLTFFYHAENKNFLTFFKIWISLNFRYIFHTLGEIKVLLK
jgi:glycosyltransferase involved in cell wall biosynthesis